MDSDSQGSNYIKAAIEKKRNYIKRGIREKNRSEYNRLYYIQTKKLSRTKTYNPRATLKDKLPKPIKILYGSLTVEL